MSRKIDRRQFVITSVGAAASRRLFGQAPAVQRSRAAKPIVIASDNGNQYRNSGKVTCVAVAAAPPAGDTKGVRITLDIASAQRQGTIFVIARPAGVTAGPPIAAKRVDTQSFPTIVELTQADSMMGQRLPANIRIEARLDGDGNPATKDPDDPYVIRDGVRVGSAVKLTLSSGEVLGSRREGNCQI